MTAYSIVCRIYRQKRKNNTRASSRQHKQAAKMPWKGKCFKATSIAALLVAPAA